MEAAIICASIHHGNTLRVATAMAGVLDAEVFPPSDADTGVTERFDLIGFGSGIYAFRHHVDLIECVDRIGPVSRGAFIFSTRGRGPCALYHAVLRRRLRNRGHEVLGEFSCLGYDTNGPLRWVGGVNRNRPNEQDLNRARDFALGLLRSVSQ